MSARCVWRDCNDGQETDSQRRLGLLMLAWALANWGKVLTGLLIVLVAVYIGILKFQLGSARGEAAELRGKVTELQAENGEWKRVYGIMSTELSKQNEAVQKAGELAKQAESKRLEAEKKAAAIQAQARHTENALQAVPASSGPDCEKELETIRQMLNVSMHGLAAGSLK